MFSEQNLKTSLPPLSKMISPKHSTVNLNQQQIQQQIPNNFQSSNPNSNPNSNSIENQNLAPSHTQNSTQSQMSLPNQSHSLIQNQTLNQQPSLFYPAANNPIMNEQTVLKSINDFSNQISTSSSQYLQNLYPSINQIRANNTGNNSPSQFSLQSNTPFSLDNLDSNDISKQRQSPLIPGFYQNLQQSKFSSNQFDFRQIQNQNQNQILNQSQHQLSNGVPLHIQQQHQNLILQQQHQHQQQQQQQQQQFQPIHQNHQFLQQQIPNITNNPQNQLDQIANIPTKCTCKQNDSTRIPRPRNAFILFRQKHHQALIEEGNQVKTNPEVSKELGRRWRALSDDDKAYWNNLAEEEKRLHAKKYPGYKYTPKRNSKKKCEYCIYKADLKEQMNKKAQQRRAQKEQKRLEKHYQQQLLQQKQQQKINQSQSPLQQQNPEFASQYPNPTIQNHLFNDMNLSNYQKYAQQIQKIRAPTPNSSIPPTQQQPQLQPSNPYYNPNINSTFQQQQQQQQQRQQITSPNDLNNGIFLKTEEYKPFNMSTINNNNNNNITLNQRLQSNDPQSQSQSQISSASQSQSNFNNLSASPNNYRVSQQNNFSTANSSTTTNSSMFTNQILASRVGTPFDYQSFNYDNTRSHLELEKKLQPNNEIQVKPEFTHVKQESLSSDKAIDSKNIGIEIKQEFNKSPSQLQSQNQNDILSPNANQNQNTVLPSINALSLPPLNISQQNE
jgi:HMG box factor